jgi:pyruvate dehydrogenase E2 component (dihydrolipoamide acetyltransferase)
MLHPGENRSVPYVTQCLEGHAGRHRGGVRLREGAARQPSTAGCRGAASRSAPTASAAARAARALRDFFEVDARFGITQADARGRGALHSSCPLMRVEAGGRIAVGDVVLVVEGRASGAPTKGRADATRAERPDRTGSRDAGTASVEPEAARRPTRPAPPDKPGMLADMLEEEAAARQPAGGTEKAGPTEPTPAPRAPAAAAPTVRRAARELGVDIHDVAGTGSGRPHLGRRRQGAREAHHAGRRPGRRSRRRPGAAVSAARLREVGRGRAQADARHAPEDRRAHERRVVGRSRTSRSATSPTSPTSRRCASSSASASRPRRQADGDGHRAQGRGRGAAAFPQFNASVDMANEEIVYKQYVHIGLAVDTDRGLLVPVIRDVDTKNITELAAELAEAAEKARTGKLTLDEMEGGCFTITNLGGIGGTYFTPIVNHPEVAILGLSSRRAMEPVWKGRRRSSRG